jgi:hypothetical protein
MANIEKVQPRIEAAKDESPPQPRPQASKTKMSVQDKMRIADIFDQDFQAIMGAMRAQLADHWDYTREMILNRLGIKELFGESKELEREVEELRVELQRIREEIQYKIFTKEQRLAELKRKALGEWDGPADPKTLRSLGFKETDKSGPDRQWMGFEIRSKLDAEVALELKDKAGVEAPAAALVTIFKSVEREFAFCSTYADAERIYTKFYSLNFRQFGVDIPPRLDDLQRLSGKKLLEVGIVEDQSRMLPSAPPGEGLKQLAGKVATDGVVGFKPTPKE